MFAEPPTKLATASVEAGQACPEAVGSGAEVAVAGTEVSVGKTAVAVGITEVEVAGTDVGGTGDEVALIGAKVSVAGIGVAVPFAEKLEPLFPGLQPQRRVGKLSFARPTSSKPPNHKSPCPDNGHTSKFHAPEQNRNPTPSESK